MPTFDYEALTEGGRLLRGTLEATSPHEARRVLEDMALAVNRIERSAPAAPRTPVGRSEFLLFNRQLAAIANAGLPLERSLRELSRDVASRRMRRLIQAVADDLERGEGIEQAFDKRRRHFPPLYGRLLTAGVTSGRLGQMLTSLNRHLETARLTRRILSEAACYPAVVLALAAMVLTGVFAWVIPLFQPLYEAMDIEPPAATEMLLAMSTNVGAFWIVAGVVLAGALVAKAVAARTSAGRRLSERVLLGLPVLGRICHAGVLARMADAMALLVSSGCDMPSCLRLAADASGSECLRHEADRLAAGIERGQGVWEASEHCRVIPRLMLYSLEWGSHRNELQDNLRSLADMYARQARANQGRLQAVLTPVLLVVVGAVVGAIIAAMFMPFVQMLRTMQGQVIL